MVVGVPWWWKCQHMSFICGCSRMSSISSEDNAIVIQGHEHLNILCNKVDEEFKCWVVMMSSEETCCIYGIWYIVDLLIYGELWQTTLLSGILNWTLCIVIVNILKYLIYAKKLVYVGSLIGSWWGDIYIPPTPGSGWGWHWHTLQLYWCWSLFPYPSRQKMLCFSIVIWSRGVRWYSEVAGTSTT